MFAETMVMFLLDLCITIEDYVYQFIYYEKNYHSSAKSFW